MEIATVAPDVGPTPGNWKKHVFCAGHYHFIKHPPSVSSWYPSQISALGLEDAQNSMSLQAPCQQAGLQSQYLSICSCNLYLLIPMCLLYLIHEHREHRKHHVCSLDHWLAKLWTGPRKSRCEGNSKGRLTCTNDIGFSDFPQSSSTVAHGIIVEWDERNDSNLDLSVDVFVLPGCVLVDKRTREPMELHNVTTSNVQHCATRCSTTLSLGPEQILQWSPRERKIKNRQKKSRGILYGLHGILYSLLR